MRAALVRGAPGFSEAGALCLICLVWFVETVSDCGARNWLRDYLLGYLVSLRSFLVWLGLRGRESATYLN